MDVWFENTAMGRYVAQNEAAFFEQHLQYFDGQTVVQQGGEWLGSSENGMDFFIWVGVGLNAWYLMLIGWLIFI